MILKQYEKTTQNFEKLHREISASGSVQDFFGITSDGSLFFILGESFNDESALDAVISSHDPTEVPQSITPTQAKRALLRFGLDEVAIMAMLNQLPTENFLRADSIIMWEDSKEFQRNNPTVLLMAQAMGWTSAQLDQLWILGSTL